MVLASNPKFTGFYITVCNLKNMIFQISYMKYEAVSESDENI